MYKLLTIIYNIVKRMSLYNKKNIVRGARYELLSELVNKKKHTIQIYFSRNELDIENINDVKHFLKINQKQDEK